MNQAKELGTENIGKLLLKFSLPAIAGMLVNALYNIVDRIYIGHIEGVGNYALSGLTITFPISTIILAFGMLVGIGAATIISIRLGENNKEAAEKTLGNAVVLDVIISGAVSILGLIFVDHLLRIFGASNESLPYARTYIRIILMGAVLQNIGFGINNSIRSEGNPRMAMLTMVFGAIINIILDPIFIFVFNLGIQGAAIATVLAETFNTIWVLHYFTSKKGGSLLKIKKKYLKLDNEIIRNIFSIGMSPFLMQLASSMVILLYNKAAYKHGGDTAIATIGIITSISQLIFMPIFGINQGSQPIIGYNYGAKSYKRVKKALKLAILSATCISTFGFLCVELFPGFLFKVFVGNKPDLINLGIHAIRIDLMFLPIIGFSIVSSNYFQSIGKAKIAIFLSLLRQVVVLIPLILILPNYFKLDGVWLSQPGADAVSFILSAIFLYNNIKTLNEKLN